MAADTIAGVVSFGILFILLLGIGWIISGLTLFRKISLAIKTEALPRRWFLLCLFPFLGHWFFDGYQENWRPLKLLHKDYEVKVNRDVSRSNWLLVQEHIDDPLAIRKGSTLTALNINNPIYLFRETDDLPNGETSIIRVTTPRRSYHEPEWAEMSYIASMQPRQSGWVVKNLRSTIPILIRQNNKFSPILPGEKSGVLTSNCRFYMGTTTYSLLKLPRLGIGLAKNNEIISEIHELCFIGTQDTCTFFIEGSSLPLVAIFDQGIITVFQGASFEIVGLSGFPNTEERILKNNSFSLSYNLIPGDKMTIEGMQFIVDYL